MKDSFNQEFKLFECISKLDSGNGTNLYGELTLNKSFSLLEVYKPHLILYIFPKVFDKSILSKFTCLFKILVKVVVQKMASFSISIYKNSEIELTSGVALIKFSNNFFVESIKKLLSVEENKIDNYLIIEKSTNESSNNIKYGVQLSNIYKRYIIKIISNCIDIDILGKVLLYFELKFLFEFNFNQIINVYMDEESKLSELHRVKILISNDFADPLSRSIMLYCKSKSIKTMIIQQGISSYSYPDWKFNFSDYTVVSGSESENHLIYQNPDLKNIHVCGIPNFDINEFRNINASLPKIKKILLTTQPYFPYSFDSRFQRIKIFYSILYLSLISKNVTLYLKPHPSEKNIYYKLFCLLSKRMIFLDKSFDVNEHIKKCDILITSFSQTAIYSVLFGKPTVTVYFSNTQSCNAEYIYSGATTNITSYKTLADTFKNDFKNIVVEDRRDTLIPWIYKRDSLAAKRINDLIYNIINN